MPQNIHITINHFRLRIKYGIECFDSIVRQSSRQYKRKCAESCVSLLSRGFVCSKIKAGKTKWVIIGSESGQEKDSPGKFSFSPMGHPFDPADMHLELTN